MTKTNKMNRIRKAKRNQRPQKSHHEEEEEGKGGVPLHHQTGIKNQILMNHRKSDVNHPFTQIIHLKNIILSVDRVNHLQYHHLLKSIDD